MLYAMLRGSANPIFCYPKILQNVMERSEMPRRKDTTDPLTRIIRAYYTTTELDETLAISRPTSLKKLNDPERFTVGEIRKLSKIPKERMRKLI